MNQQSNSPVDYQNMEGFFSNGNLFRFIWKWKIVFLLTFIAAAVFGVIFSGPAFITPKFKSEAIVYPINLTEYGDENTTEQMLQLLQSADLSFRLVNGFDLYNHYEIDPNDPYAQTYMLEELSDHVSFSKTNYESVRITVLDKDPQQAAAMADSINTYYNQLAKAIDNVKSRERIFRDSSEMVKIQIENDSLKAKLKNLRQEVRIFNPGAQAEEITEAYLANSENAGELYQNLVDYQDEIIFLDSLIAFNNSRFLEYKDDHDENLTELNRKQIYSTMVSKPVVADKKSYPVRWLILSGIVLAALITAFIVLLIIENIKRTPRSV
jgi:capsular polysaccharide biosynthesis protein